MVEASVPRLVCSGSRIDPAVMNASPELGLTIRQSSPKHDYHHQNGPLNATMEYQHYGGGNVGQQQQQQQQQQQTQQQQQQDLTIDGIPNNFPHRRSRASRTFKNPPQPHMCIKEKTLDGKEVFINVLSWTRIANPDNPDAPIPLYGGMKVGKMPPGSPKVPPLVYAVMASPEVLKKAGRKCPDTPERMNLVDLMCEFVEAMNPSLHLSKKPEILKDRDLSGELKDVWSAVQACRDKGRSDNGPPENLVVYTEFGPDSAPSYEQTIHQQQQQQQLEQHYQQHQQQHQQQQQQLAEQQCLANYQSMFPQAYSQEVQSAISSQVPEARDVIEQRSAVAAATGPAEPDGSTNGINTATSRPPAAATGTGNGDEELAKQTESLKLSSSAHRTNGGLPADGASGPQHSATATSLSSTTATTTMTSSSSSSTVPQTQTSPTATNAPPAKEPTTKNSTGHTFFPMFRSSKSSNSSNGGSVSNSGSNNANGTGGGATNAQHNASTAPTDAKGVTVNGGADTPDGDGGGGGGGAGSPKTTKPAGKKSGLYFFRRNKSSTSSSSSSSSSADSKKDPPSTPTKQQPPAASVTLPAALTSAASAPATPAATGAACTGSSDSKLIYQYHLDAGTNGNGGGGVVGGGGNGTGGTGGGGTGDIIETANSATTIVAK